MKTWSEIHETETVKLKQRVMSQIDRDTAPAHGSGLTVKTPWSRHRQGYLLVLQPRSISQGNASITSTTA